MILRIEHFQIISRVILAFLDAVVDVFWVISAQLDNVVGLEAISVVLE